MPTSAQPGTPTSPQEPHKARHVAESFGEDAERYDRARPRYPDAMVRRIIAASPGHDVLDVGAGTGIEARQFQEAGCRVLAVEPDARMAEVTRRGGTEVEVATFEAWEPAGRTFDAVIAGTAWHWVDPVAGAAKAAQVLRPGGRMAAFWHVSDQPPTVAAVVTEILRRAAPDLPIVPPREGQTAVQAYQPLLTKAAGGLREVGRFGEPEQWQFDWQTSYTRAEWLDLMPTFGLLTRLPPDTLDEVLAGAGAAIDALGGRITVDYATVVVTAVRTP
ncbi:class I SAM-dependent methyltransferase [Nonomuraea candida]|uniref:class I SAM-dependent methyltransferase n=1 Tax=Nonomuraea candida TaxID=359159 RepID=UPI0005BB3984|nr:class I SAM-dependent methyltransferase [Nonomuraea candida]